MRFLANIFRDSRGRPLPYIKEFKRTGKLTIVRLRGDIDFDTVQIVSRNIDNEMLGNFDRNILLDFKEVTNVDSSTLAYLVSLLDRLQNEQRKLGIVNATAELDNYIKIGKIDSIIHRYKDKDTALKELA